MIKSYVTKQQSVKAVQMAESPFNHGESEMFFTYEGLIFSSQFIPKKGDWVVKEDGLDPYCVRDYIFRHKYEV